MNKSIIFYESNAGSVKIELDPTKKTVWVNQDQISKIFNIDQSVISRHIKNIFKDKEINQKSNMQKMHIPNSDKKVNYYSLDVVLGVGYRTNSAKAISFRQWATKILNKYITEGYAINRKLIRSNYQLFTNTVSDLKKLLPATSSPETLGIMEIISIFAQTWLSLDAYDKSILPQKGQTLRTINLSAKNLATDVKSLKSTLQGNKTASELFAVERNQGAL